MAVVFDKEAFVFTPPVGAAALVGDMTDWFKRPAIALAPEIRIPATSGTWMEYAWLDEKGQPFADPENEKKSLNPWWSYPRAAVAGNYPKHPLTLLPEATEKGTTHRLSWESGLFGNKRRAVVYLPHNHKKTTPIDVYYVQDGIAFYRIGKLGELMDKAVQAKLIEGAALVFVEPVDRNEEYYLNDTYLDFLKSEVFSLVEGEYLKPKQRGLWGASLGGLISLYLGSRSPELFSKVVSHSGAFIAKPNTRYENGIIDTTTAGEWLLGELLKNPPKHLKISLDTGTLEWLTGANRRMAAAFADNFVGHQYKEYKSGHNWVTWQAALPEALLYMQS